MIECPCGDPNCKTKISVDLSDGVINVYGPESQILMYMDPNTTVQLIKALREMLIKFSDMEDI